MAKNNVKSAWRFAPGIEVESTQDPRAALAEHMGWVRTSKSQTTWRGLEPDTINRCIVALQPALIDGIKTIVWYRRTIGTKTLWYSLMRTATPQEEQAVTDYVMMNDYIGFWSYDRAEQPREIAVEL
jgi:hypothetical protein